MNRNLLGIGFLLLVLALPTSAEKANVDVELVDWELVEKGPPDGLRELAEEARAAVVNISAYETEKRENFLTLYRAVFISGDGLALCPLYAVCTRETLAFTAADPTKEVGFDELPAPVVLTTFPDSNTALLKFDYKPRKHLRFSKEKVPLGSWVAIVTFPHYPEPVMGPVLMHREGGAYLTGESKEKPKSLPKCYTIAGPKVIRGKGTYVQGSPVINRKGELVAAFNDSNNLGDVIYRNASPLHGYAAYVANAVARNEKSRLPLKGQLNPIDALVLDPLYLDLLKKFAQSDWDGAQAAYNQLEQKFPHSMLLKDYKKQLIAGRMRSAVGAGEMPQRDAAERLLALELKEELPEDATDWEKAKYHSGLGYAYGFAENTDKAIEHFKIADEVNPACMASYMLGSLFGGLGNEKMAEQYLRRAVQYEPSRAIYWDELSRNPNVGFEEAMEIQRRCDLINKLFGTL